MSEIPPLNPFSMNMYMSMFEIFFNFTPDIFNTASELKPEDLK